MLAHRMDAIKADKRLQTPEVIKMAELQAMPDVVAFKQSPHEKENAEVYSSIYDFGWWFGLDNFAVFERNDFNALQTLDVYFNDYLTWFGNRPLEQLASLSGSQLDCVVREESRYNPFFEPLIIDTLNFIATGKRNYSLNLLRMYMREYRMSCQSDVDYALDKYSYPTEKLYVDKDLKGLSSYDFYNKWISQRDGAEDLILTYRLLFNKL